MEQQECQRERQKKRFLAGPFSLDEDYLWPFGARENPQIYDSSQPASRLRADFFNGCRLAPQLLYRCCALAPVLVLKTSRITPHVAVVWRRLRGHMQLIRIDWHNPER
jgi:hypothetical protein